MTASEAYNKFISENDNLVVLSCYEYDSCFVFEAVPSNRANTDAQHMVFDSQIAVNKTSGEIAVFKPFDVPIDEYKRGKKILIKELQNHSTIKTK